MRNAFTGITKVNAAANRPLIGICANYSTDDKPGIITGLGLPGQEWQLLADDYVKCIERAGGIPIIIPITEDFSCTTETLGILDGLLFTGGSDIDPQFYNQLPKKGLGAIDPKRDEHEIALAKKVLFEMDMPVLGICRGIQILNVACGGTLYQDLALERPEGFNHTIIEAPKYYPTHKVKIKEQSKIHHIFKSDEIKVNSFNHQGINRLAEEFEATMVAEDGLIEGIEMKGSRFVIAVQWHPEMMVERYPEYMVIFEEFVKGCIIKGGDR